MRTRSIILSIMLCFALPASAQVSVSVGFQVANIGVSLSTYPNLVRVPGYPVYYADGVNSNYFFYDGMYWVFETDRWYSSSWYNGPWMMVDPEFIPVYILRVPVRYYRHPPAYFGGWHANRPPRWHDHWGQDWAQRRSGWDRWDRRSAPAPAPLPTYQRKYSGERYPAADQQPVLHDRNYRYKPSDPLVRQQSRAATENRPDRAPRGTNEQPERRGAEPQAARPSPAPAAHEPAAADRQAPRQQPTRDRPEQQPPSNAQRSEERPVPRSSPPEPRQMPPSGEPKQQHMTTPREDRPSSGRGESGQRRGQQGQSEKSDDRGRGPDRDPDRGSDRGSDRGR